MYHFRPQTTRKSDTILMEIWRHYGIQDDGSGLKTNNAGEYRSFKYGERKGQHKYVIVIITADSHHKLLYVDAHIEGEGSDEPVIARKQ